MSCKLLLTLSLKPTLQCFFPFVIVGPTAPPPLKGKDIEGPLVGLGLPVRVIAEVEYRRVEGEEGPVPRPPALPSSSASNGIVDPRAFWLSCRDESSSSSSSTSLISSCIWQEPPCIAKASCSIFIPNARKRIAAAHNVHTCGSQQRSPKVES